MSDRFSCARASLRRDEPLFATASTISRWVLLEQPGPWGADAVRESRLPGEAAEAIHALGRTLRARVLLVRRHGRPDDDPGPVAAFVASTREADPWVERFALERPAELLDLDLGPLRHHRRVGGRPWHDPLYLVCTNGSHDVCCAEFGRPLAAALSAARPDEAWECSHIGGDRFAANLLVLPHGLYYGRVTPDESITVVQAHEDGRLALPWYRGRSCYPFVVQAAEHFVREEGSLDGIDDLRLVSASATESDRHEVTFESPSRRWVLTVGVRPDADGQQLTCGSTGPSCPPRYRLDRITELAPAVSIDREPTSRPDDPVP